jgi:hypothetical protein
MTGVCKTCTFWHAQKNDGECRRYPPTAFMVLTQSPLGQQPAFTAAFPRIRGDLGCGEHKSKIDLQ